MTVRENTSVGALVEQYRPLLEGMPDALLLVKLKVVADGVETEEQSRLLRLLGCDEMQGYLFSKPVPSEIFEARFLARPPSSNE